jgi:flavin-dependent dehydrogenase
MSAAPPAGGTGNAMFKQRPTDPITSDTPQAAAACDVFIIGGGPAGTTAATLLRAMGHHVVLAEKSEHPRFHIGESLLPANLPLFEKLGVGERIKALGMPKYAAEFTSPWHDHLQEFKFADAWTKTLPSAYQVERARFDFVLFDNARSKGVEVMEGCEVTAVDLVGTGGMATVQVRTKNGERRAWNARFVVDASGRETFIASKLHLKARSIKHNSVAVYAHFRGALRHAGTQEGNISIFWFDHGWFWFIPLIDGVTSVGMVTWPYFMKTRGEMPLVDFFKNGIAACKPLALRLEHAQMINDVVATGNYSYESRRAYGRNFVLLGDAYAFVDPMFSSGVWLAMHSGDQAATTIDTCLRRPAAADAALEVFERSMKKGPKEYSWFIHRVTNPTMRQLFMYPSDKFRMKAALLSLLAGDIFGKTPIWRSIAVLKSAYYLVSLTELQRSYRGWLRRRVNIARDPAVESRVTSQ